MTLEPSSDRLARGPLAKAVAGLWGTYRKGTLLSPALCALAASLFDSGLDGEAPLLPALPILAGALLCHLPAAWFVHSYLGPLRGASGQLSPELLGRLVKLPRRLAATQLGAWLLTAAGAAAAALVVEPGRPDRAFAILLAALLAGVGTALAVLTRTGVLLSGLWPQLAPSLPVSAWPRRATNLRSKLTLVLGGVVFFASAFGLFSAFSMQREIVAWHVAQQSGEVRRSAATLVESSSSPDCTSLALLAPEGGALVFAAPGRECRFGRPLPEATETMLARAPAGPLTLPSEELEGHRFELVTGGAPAVLTVLYPQPEWARRVLLLSLAFYTLLFAFSALLAAQTARELLKPVEVLGERVERLEAGDLGEPLLPPSTDEVGELSFALESMRAGLAASMAELRTLNLTLEEKVTLRTQELEATNGQLRTALVRLQEAQVRLVQSEKMAALGRLVSGLTHELNNPVNAIVNSAGPLLEKLTNPGTAERDHARLLRAARVVDQAARRTQDLLRSLASFSRHGEQVTKPVALGEAVSATLLLLHHRVESQGTQMEVAVAEELPPVAFVPGELGQVLMNLLANALEAVAGRGPSGVVRLSAGADGHEVVFECCDNGPGIPPADRLRVFEPFFSTKEGGTGLGLAITHELIQRNRGRIEVDEAPDGGCCMRLRLPMFASS